MYDASESASVTISCRNVWKIYGADPGRYASDLGRGDEPVAELAARMRQEGHIPACCDVSFDVHAGEIFVIMGLSGSGKSTIVRCLSRLVEPTAGSIVFDGQDLLKMSEEELIEVRRHRIGMVFQNFGLLPHLNVLDNIAFPLRLQNMTRKKREERAGRLIELVGLEGREKSFPRELSGGQQQRVGIARSLTVEPDLWLLDEPFSALDPLIRRQMQDEFLRLQLTLKKSIVFITHDFMEALRVADRMAIMRDGFIVQEGTPQELVVAPADDYVREFTSEVPLMRILRADQLLDGDWPAGGDLPQVAADETAEQVVVALGRSPEGVSVVGADGKTLGIVTAASLIARLSRDLGGNAPEEAASA